MFQRTMILAAALGVVVLADRSCGAADRQFEELRRYKAAEAHQGVAVDSRHFYAITNRAIGKYERQTGKQVARWAADKARPLIHLNAGIVVDGKLYCAHSNSPGVPATSSLEIWDADTLKHVGSRSFGIYEGSLTWVDRHEGSWWAVFAHYPPKQSVGSSGKDARWTSLVQFDDKWRRQQAWVFPQAVLKRFAPHSNSGGGWGPDGRLYCTGHDRAEVYVLQLPKAGSTLEFIETLPLNIAGQAIAWDRSQRGVLFGINRPKREVIELRLSNGGDTP